MSLPPLAVAIAKSWPPDPLTAPERYRGITLARVLAYCIDVVVIGLILLLLQTISLILTVVSFGLLWPLHYLIIPTLVALAYHSLQTSGPAAATIGMRCFGLRAYSVLGGRPSFGQALLHTVLFYATLVPSGGLLMLVALFNRHRRTIHDLLAGVLVLRKVVL